MSILLVLGTRPQIIKSAPIFHEGLRQGLELGIVHTGQHYDYRLSQVFLEEFSLSDPIINLSVGSGSHASQTAEIMLGLEKYLIESKPSMVVVPGDTNSALAAALAPVKLGIPVAHVEAGARCYDMRMAEEINRRLIDHCSEILFPVTDSCKENLKKESVLGEIHMTGDTMYDAFLTFKGRVGACDILSRLELTDKEYALLTLHRAENVDDPMKLKNIINGIQEAGINVLFPIHPRTKKRLEEQNISLDGSTVKTIEPVDYIEMLKLLKHTKMVLTDSGGVQKEAFWSKTPCITIRERTEWTETIEMGVNLLTETDPKTITQTIKYVEENHSEIKNRFKINPFGDGRASERIIEILKQRL
ncbi:MAG: hypothetical protein QG670_62 [Thermoproteota archaeon]|nr:hypothetical protein [Thermoproteota archaeon]